jgi:hypothetical protein
MVTLIMPDTLVVLAFFTPFILNLNFSRAPISRLNLGLTTTELPIEGCHLQSTQSIKAEDSDPHEGGCEEALISGGN